MRTIQAKVVTIGDTTYAIKPLPAGLATEVLVRVGRMAAPAFADLTSLRDAAKAVGSLVSGLLVDADPATVKFLEQSFAGVTEIVGANDKRASLASVFDVHFSGYIVEQLEWLKAAAEVTYGPLLARLTAPSPAPQAQAPREG